jgi:hypothetical protein
VLKRYVAGWRKFHRETADAEIMPKLLAKQHFNIRLIVDHENEEIHAMPRLAFNTCWNVT